MKQKKILILLLCVAMGFVVTITGYAQDDGDKKESPNDYYKNEEFKEIVDNIIKNYGGAEAIKQIKYCRLDTRSTYTHETEIWLYETSLFCAITDTEPAIMKYRREDYLKGPKDSKKQLMSGITFNGQEVIQLPMNNMGTTGLKNTVNRLFDERYLFTSAFNIRLIGENYSVVYKGKEKNKEIGKDVYIIELKDTDPEYLKERTTLLYYNTSSYLLEAMRFEDELLSVKAQGLPVKIQNPTFYVLVLIKEHKSYEIKVNNKKQSIKYISRLSVKSWRQTGDPQKDIPPKDSTIVEIKTSFDKFNEDIFDKKE
jgi:hypothetical protein